MSKTIYDVTLLELLPPNLRSIPEIIAVGRAIDKQWQKLATKIKEVLTFADVDNASSEVVDMLAAEMNVDFYNPALPLAKRRALVKNGYIYKYRNGTAYAVKQIVTDAFDRTMVKEWFDYDGEPFYFKISTETKLPSESKIAEVVQAVNSVKNVRSKLECVEAVKNAELKNYYGFGVQQTYYRKVSIPSA